MLIYPTHQPQARNSTLIIIATAIGVFLFTHFLIPKQFSTHIPYYLLWHTILQGLGIVMAAQIFTLILSTYKNKLPTSLATLGIIFLGVAIFDFSHALIQQGMPKILDTDYQSRAPFLIFFSRLLSACSIFFISLCPWNRVFDPRLFLPVLIPFLLIIAFIQWVIFFHPSSLPNVYEYSIAGILLCTHLNIVLLALYAAATLILFKRLKKNQRFAVKGFYLSSALFTLAQAYNINPWQDAQLDHLISHLYGITAIYLLYRAVFNEIVLRPYTLLRDSKQRMAATLNATPDMILELDGHGNLLAIHNHDVDKKFLNREAVLGKNIDRLLTAENTQICRNSLEQAKNFGVSRNHIIKIESPYQEKHWFELSVSFVSASIQDNERYIVIARDITQRVQETEKLEFLSRAVDQIPSMIFILDKDLTIQFINHAFTITTGYSFTEIKGKPAAQLFAPSTAVDLQKHIKKEIQSGNIWQGEIERCTKFGKEYTVHSSFYPVLIDNQTTYSYLVIENDISANKQIAAQLQRVSNFDRLTGLPNFERLHALLNHELKHATHLAILWINLDHFKNINDGLGHQVGDLLLKEVADRLSNLLRPQDVLARPNSDNFVMVLRGAEHTMAATQAQAVLDSFNSPLVSARRSIVLSATIGIAIYPWDSPDGAALLSHAETAMHRMKEKSRGGYCFFKSEMREETTYKLVISMALKEALKNNELHLVYQPQVSLSTGQLIGVEALLRWHSPIWGTIPPSEFIPIAEESGDIVQIGQWVLNQAWQQMQQWEKINLPVPYVSVNISATQFEQEDFIDTVVQLIGTTHPINHRLVIELTEAVAMSNPTYSAAMMKELKKHQIKIAIDDFGTGYSSLGSLKSFAIDTIKIDRSFINDVHSNKGDQAVVNAIINMAHDLGMTIIAEGVENEKQLLYLQQKGCDAVQGFYFSPPLTATALEQLLTLKYPNGCFCERLHPPLPS